MLYDMRVIKSSSEIQLMRETCRIGAEAIKSAISQSRHYALSDYWGDYFNLNSMINYWLLYTRCPKQTLVSEVISISLRSVLFWDTL